MTGFEGLPITFYTDGRVYPVTEWIRRGRILLFYPDHTKDPLIVEAHLLMARLHQQWDTILRMPTDIRRRLVAMEKYVIQKENETK